MLGISSIARSVISRSCLSGKSPVSCFLKFYAAINAISTTTTPRINSLDLWSYGRMCVCSFSSSSRAEMFRNDKLEGESKKLGRLWEHFVPNHVSRTIEIIRRDEDDMEANLNLLSPKLSTECIAEIFQVLNSQKLSGLRFFRWVQVTNPRLFLSSGYCSLIINNCGWIGDYDNLLCLLKEFKVEGICLTKSAFGFLPVVGFRNASKMDAVRSLVDMLNRVGGSCRSSGICALVNMFCELNWFDMAEQVIEMSEKKTPYYHILIRQRCKRGHIKEVHGIIERMKESNCRPKIQTYNYLLSSLSKVDEIHNIEQMIEEVKETGICPDAITYEILIKSYCRSRKVDFAMKLMDTMINCGLEPRLQTHNILLKEIFKSKEYEAAHNYVVDMSGRHKQFTSVMYCLLADLYLGSEQLVEAQYVIIEMMDKGMKPDSRVYGRILRKLETSSRKDLIEDLQHKYSGFHS